MEKQPSDRQKTADIPVVDSNVQCTHSPNAVTNYIPPHPPPQRTTINRQSSGICSFTKGSSSICTAAEVFKKCRKLLWKSDELIQRPFPQPQRLQCAVLSLFSWVVGGVERNEAVSLHPHWYQFRVLHQSYRDWFTYGKSLLNVYVFYTTPQQDFGHGVFSVSIFFNPQMLG